MDKLQQLLREVPIRWRLLGGMAAASLLVLALGVWAAMSYAALQTQTDTLLDTLGKASRDSGAALASIERLQRHEQSVLLNSNNAVEAAEHQQRWTKEVAAAEKMLDGSTEGAAALKAYTTAIAPVLQQVVDAKLDSTAGYAYAQRAQPELERARAAVAQRVTATDERIAAERAQTRERGKVEQGMRLVAAAVVLGVGCLLMWLVARSIAAPLARAAQCAQRIAQGDLSEHIVVTGRDEVSAFKHALADMQRSLRDIVGQVRASADSINTASTEVAVGNQDLSQRTEHAASNLQATAASLQQLTGTVRGSADSAAQAARLAAGASDVAQRGGDAVAQVVRTMSDINASSRQIADITGVIDGIAFQTNILALNAAVEAARAGEQGRGFAVVASEVRSLAQRAASAAQQIKTLIETSVERVENGARQAADAGSTMAEIVGSVRHVSDIIGEISSSASEQSAGIGHVNGAVAQLDQMTQQNAALVEQSAAAAESLKEHAGRLNGLVGTFRLQET